jgi:hypothetical protein
LDERYILPVEGARQEVVTDLLTWIVVALLVAGVVELLRRREPGPLLYLVPAAVTLAVVEPRVTPYADAKMLALLSPAVLATAAFGLRWLRGPMQPAAIALGCAVAAGVLFSAYHGVNLAPTERMEAIEDVGERFEGHGPILFTEFEEFAKHFASDAKHNVGTEAVTPYQVELRSGREFYGYHFDLDEATLDYVERFPLIAVRRAPDASRPPANYRPVYRNDFYDVWERRTTPQVVEHLSLQLLHHAELPARCSDVLALASRAGPRDRLVAAEVPERVGMNPLTAPVHPAGWHPHPTIGDTALAATPGRVEGQLRVSGGRYAVWVRGSFGRPIEVSVGGRTVGSVKGINTPSGWHRAGSVELAAGMHDVELSRGGGNLAPGDGAEAVVGPTVLERVEAAGLVEFPPSRARDLCGRELDWIELVRPR